MVSAYGAGQTYGIFLADTVQLGNMQSIPSQKIAMPHRTSCLRLEFAGVLFPKCDVGEHWAVPTGMEAYDFYIPAMRGTTEPSSACELEHDRQISDEDLISV